MKFKDILRPLREGKKVRLPSWGGYWQKEGNEIMMFCHDGRTINLRESDNIFWTLENICSEEWEIVGEIEAPISPCVSTETVYCQIMDGYLNSGSCINQNDSEILKEVAKMITSKYNLSEK